MAQTLYKAAEACKIAEVAPYVLRYWETEFPVLSEGKEKGAARQYSERDVNIIARIRELLYDEGFTVAGAKKRLDAEISEGRFDDGRKAPSPAEQRKEQARATTAAAAPPVVSESAAAAFLSEPMPRKATAARADFPDRKRVVKELKEIVGMLQQGRKR